MTFSVMAGLVPAIHVVRLAHAAQMLEPTGRRQYRRLQRHWTTWMAETSPAMTVGAADVTRFIQGDRPKAGAELAMTASEIAARRSRAANIIASIEGGACGPSVAWLSTTSARAEFEMRWMRAAGG